MASQPSDIKLKFPLREFLTQPLFQPQQPVILNPRRFWQVYTIQLLERCWTKPCSAPGHQHH